MFRGVAQFTLAKQVTVKGLRLILVHVLAALHFIFIQIYLPKWLKLSDCGTQCVYKLYLKNNDQLKCKECNCDVQV